jgi:hypothetical protein
MVEMTKYGDSPIVRLRGSGGGCALVTALPLSKVLNIHEGAHSFRLSIFRGFEHLRKTAAAWPSPLLLRHCPLP